MKITACVENSKDNHRPRMEPRIHESRLVHSFIRENSWTVATELEIVKI
jgi:hypothetical protein